MSWRDLAENVQDTELEVLGDTDDDGRPLSSYEPEGGTTRDILGIFFEPHVEQQLGSSEAPVSTWETSLHVKIADLLPDWPLREDSRFVVRRPAGGDPKDYSAESVYECHDHHLDGEGMVKLLLRPARRP